MKATLTLNGLNILETIGLVSRLTICSKLIRIIKKQPFPDVL